LFCLSDVASPRPSICKAIAGAAATHGVSLRVRCGLHAGLVEHRDNDYFVSAVNRAPRIMMAAHGGQVLLSSAVVDCVKENLPALSSRPRVLRRESEDPSGAGLWVGLRPRAGGTRRGGLGPTRLSRRSGSLRGTVWSDRSRAPRQRWTGRVHAAPRISLVLRVLTC